LHTAPAPDNGSKPSPEHDHALNTLEMLETLETLELATMSNPRDSGLFSRFVS
jgi:hypothetical protein